MSFNLLDNTNETPSSSTGKAAKRDTIMADANTKTSTPSKSQKQHLTASRPASHRSAAGTPTPHLNDRSATRKASRRDLIMGKADNIEKQSSQPQKPQLSEEQYLRQRQLLQQQQQRRMTLNPGASQGQSSSQQAPRLDERRAALLHAQQRSRSLAPSGGERQQLQAPHRERDRVAKAVQQQQQQRAQSLRPSASQSLRPSASQSLRPSASQDPQQQMQEQRRRSSVLDSPAKAPNQTHTQPQQPLRRSTNAAALNQAPPPPQQQQLRRPTNPTAANPQHSLRAKIVASLQQRRATQAEPPMEASQLEDINELLEGFDMIAQHARSQGMSHASVAKTFRETFQRWTDRMNRGLPMVEPDGGDVEVAVEKERNGVGEGDGEGAGSGGGARRRSRREKQNGGS